MHSDVTSFVGVFALRADGESSVQHIEIPLIQRDYAQGRLGPNVERIRNDFVGVLHGAVTGLTLPVGLDFVFGTVRAGRLQPLDGQQRLTTLFLLHWYLAARAERLDERGDWKNFTYATRASARLFCERLAKVQWQAFDGLLSEWLRDQSWFHFGWRQDPTISSMLVMLDTLHARFRDDDCLAAWKRLVAPQSPAITFHLLPVAHGNAGVGDELYIKMNSRGKPLTSFENFKARFEQFLDQSGHARASEFSRKVDSTWADLFWRHRGDDDLIDDEFLRYFLFVTELCEWEGEGAVGASEAVDARASRVFREPRHFELLLNAFDTWGNGESIAGFFGSLFAAPSAPPDFNHAERVTLYGPRGDERVDLFQACCERYGNLKGRNREFSLQFTLLFYAALLHRLEGTPNFPARLRVLRNLIEASVNEVRLERMPELLIDVRYLVVDGKIDAVAVLNHVQATEEKKKEEFLTAHPALREALFRLEDHPLLRGSLVAFELDDEVFERRAKAFERVASPSLWPKLTGALLAMGDYARYSYHSQFGSAHPRNPESWRAVFTTGDREALSATRAALGRLLDAVGAAESEGELTSALEGLREKWVGAVSPARGLDWRWYFVRYEQMRQGRSGRYMRESGTGGYGVCMLDKERMSSNYRDPFLSAVVHASGVTVGERALLFTGPQTVERWLDLASGVGLRCLAHGFALRPPRDATRTEDFLRVCGAHDVVFDEAGRASLRIPQLQVDGVGLDIEDRVDRAQKLLRDFAAAGL